MSLPASRVSNEAPSELPNFYWPRGLEWVLSTMPPSGAVLRNTQGAAIGVLLNVAEYELLVAAAKLVGNYPAYQALAREEEAGVGNDAGDFLPWESVIRA